MPYKNVIKTYVSDGYYHVYNRGVNKRRIFTTAKDYKTFLSYLKSYLSPPPPPIATKTFVISTRPETFIAVPYQHKNYYQEIELVAYSLMPNHFHLLLHQQTSDSIAKFMKSLSTRYATYFNRSHHRIGGLFESHYKAALVDTDTYLLHLSRYIHLNPSGLFPCLEDAFSSYFRYLGISHTSWIKPKIILDFFKRSDQFITLKHTTYKNFVEDYQLDSLSLLNNLALDN